MPIVLLVLGILLAGAGAVAIGFGMAISGLNLGIALIPAGAMGLVGGLLLIGLSAAVRELAQVGKALRDGSLQLRPALAVEPAPLVEPKLDVPAVPQETAETPKVEPPAEPVVAAAEAAPAADAASVDVSASAIERLRSTIPRPDRVVPEADGVPLSPNGSQPAAPAAPQNDRGAPASGIQTLREPRLDFLVRPRPSRPAPPETFDTVWPKRATREAPAAIALEEPQVAAAETVVAAPARAEPESKPEPKRAPDRSAEGPRSVAVLKSGVVDGMAYTLYADGSIEAQVPQGTMRFGSIAELRAHIENHQ
jgi:hypothetical protein